MTYPPEAIEQALLAMVYTRQIKAAQEQLKLAGVDPVPSYSTMKEWKTRFSGRMAELTEQHGAEIERHVVSKYLDIVGKAVNVTDILLDKTVEQAEEGTLRDPAGSARNAAVIAAMFQDKVLLIQGKPTQIIGKEKDAEEAIRRLADKFAVNSDAEEEKPKEIEETNE